ncbi:MAG: C1 family peptidase [Chloroflexota bacterium]
MSNPVKRILNCLPSPGTEQDWGIEQALAAEVLAAAPALPMAVDLRANWWEIGDQGSTGSCVGWAAADSLLRWHFVQAGRLAQNVRLSVRFAWMAAKETDEFFLRPSTFIETDGTSLKAALDIARKYGAVKDSILPFKNGRLYQGDGKTFYALAAQYRIASYFNLGTNLNDWRWWLANQGPVLTRLNVDDTWDNATDSNGNLDFYQPHTIRGGHAVVLVGYTPQRFIVRNSWGANWGDEGFGYASPAYAQAAFTEAYGITV